MKWMNQNLELRLLSFKINVGREESRLEKRERECVGGREREKESLKQKSMLGQKLGFK